MSKLDPPARHFIETGRLPKVAHTINKSDQVYRLTVKCPHCGTGHLDGPGDDSTWRCRNCNKLLRPAP